MATIAPSIQNISDEGIGNASSRVITWANLTQAGSDVGGEVSWVGFPDRAVQVAGTFGVGGAVVIEGSIDGSNYAPLTDPQGNALSFTAAKIEAISELVRFIRPRVTAGDGTTSLTVSLIVRFGGK
jgi:hypothetical protein